MIKRYPLLLFCLLASIGLHAAEKITGQIILTNNQTLNTTLFIPVGLFGGGPNTEALQKRVRYLDPKGKKKWLRPEYAKEFRFTLNGQEFRMVSCPYAGAMFASRVFLLQLIDGPVKMFEYRVTTRSGGGPNMPMTTSQRISYLLQRGDDPLNEPNVFGFKKEMAKYFADCPTLVDLIENKDFKRRDIGEIVIYYNTKCK